MDLHVYIDVLAGLSLDLSKKTPQNPVKKTGVSKTTPPSPKGFTLVAPKQVHWGSKVTSLRRLASELCLGLEVRQRMGSQVL